MISFIKNLQTINQTYNDNVIKFQSTSVSNPIKAEVTVSSLGLITSLAAPTFTIVPLGNTFTFNFKEVIKSIINTNRFEDTRVPNFSQPVQQSNASNIYIDTSMDKIITAKITVFGTNGQDTVTANYTFIRGVEQLFQLRKTEALAPTLRLLLPTNDYVNYRVKYWEGYPFDFAIYGIGLYQPYYFRNITTNVNSNVYNDSGLSLVGSSRVKRVFLSDGANDATFDDSLVLSSTLNRMELWVNGQFKVNIDIRRMESECGIYLKWLNSKGAYSYWKFDSTYNSVINPRSLGEFTGEYDNLRNLKALTYQIGKTATQTMNISSNFEREDAEYLADLSYSPAVWMYTYQAPFNKQKTYDFIGVNIKDVGFKVIDSKNNRNKVELSIIMPEIQTITN